MSPTALLLVLASAAMHATWNALLKKSADAAAAATVIVAGAAGLSAVLAVVTGTAYLPTPSLPWVTASAVIEAAYFVSLAAAMARLPLGTAYGVSRGGGQLVTWPISALWLGEKVNAVAIAGAALVTGGLFATTRGGGTRGLGYALGCAFAIGLYPLTYKTALGAGAPEAALFATSLSLSLPVQAALLGPERVARLRRLVQTERRTLIVGAVLCAASFLTFLAALSLGGAGRASALRNTSVLFALLAGWALGDRPSRGAAVGGALIAIGAAMVSW